MSTIPTPVSAGLAVAPRSVQWGAVILGALGAIAISMVLLTFGAGIGLASISAHPYAGASAKALAVISGLYAAVVTVASYAAGGYIAGRMRLPPTPEEVAEADFRDGAHGFAVWALGLILFALLAASGIGGVVKTAAQATAAITGAAAAGAASNPVAGQAAQNALSTSPTDYAVDRLLAPTPNAGGPAPADQAAGGQQRTTGMPSNDNAAIARAFASALKSGQLEQRDRDMLTGIVMQRTGLPQAEAQKRVDEAYAELKQAEQKARDAAEAARKAALIAAFATAAIALLACAAACVGASAGARHRHAGEKIILFGSARFW